MILAQRYCQIQGHQSYSSSHICTFQFCDQGSRWVCAECFAQELHQHDQVSNIHLMNQQQFKILINQLHNKENQDSKDLQNEIQQYIQQISKLIRQLELYQQYSQKETDDDKICFSTLQFIDNDFYSLDNDQISQILKIQNKKSQQFNNEQLLITFQQITSQSQEIEQQIKKHLQSQQQILINQSHDYKYHTKLNSIYTILTAQISQNEQYLAFGGWEQLLIIYDLNLDEDIKQIQLDQHINICLFSNDSKLLYVGCEQGYLYYLNIANNYSQIFKQYLNKDGIYNIIEQSNQIIITSHKTDIIITNIKLQSQIIKIENAHTDSINALTYNKNYFIIVSGSLDKSIKLFNSQSGLILISRQQAHDKGLWKIQQFNNKLLSLSSDGILKYWQIDYQNKDLILLNQLQDENQICNFDYVNQKEIIIICKKYFKTLDEGFKVIKWRQHSQNEDVFCKIIKYINSQIDDSNTINELCYNMWSSYIIYLLFLLVQFAIMKRIQKKQ